VRASLQSDAPVEFSHRKEPSNTFPLVLRGVDIYLTEEDIKNGNTLILTASRFKRNGDPIRKVKITVAERATRDKMLADGVLLRWDFHQQLLQTESYILHERLKQCFKCQLYGHLSTTCVATNNICGKCTSESHLTRDCPHKGPESKIYWKCALCGGNHRTSHFSCPERKKFVDSHPPARSYAEVTALRTQKIVSPYSMEAKQVIDNVRRSEIEKLKPSSVSFHTNPIPYQSPKTDDEDGRSAGVTAPLPQSRRIHKIEKQIEQLTTLVQSLYTVLKTFLTKHRDLDGTKTELLVIFSELEKLQDGFPNQSQGEHNIDSEEDEDEEASSSLNSSDSND
jgi:hypothetical protein